MLRAIAVVFACVIGSTAIAHENPTDWIGQERRTNGKNELCCGKGDCFPFTSQQMKMTSEGIAFPDEPDNIIPFTKFAPSADGFFWKCIWGGETKCVFAPIGGV
jgi:hypothetical protein